MFLLPTKKFMHREPYMATRFLRHDGFALRAPGYAAMAIVKWYREAAQNKFD